MKKLLSILTLFLMLSCSSDFIDLLPEDTVSTDNLYQSESDFGDAVIGVYHVLLDQYQDMYYFGDLRGDDTYDELVKDVNSRVDLFAVNDDEGLFESTWSNYYMMIYRANLILSNIEDKDVSVVTNKNRHIGEAKFLRALAYFDLVRIFGDVPMITAPITIEESYQIGREPVANVYSQVIIPDLLDAESKLPATYGSDDVGRATQGAAKSLLGKVYLTTHDFASAEAKLEEVTKMGYALLPDYNDLFTFDNEHHSEYIFDVEYEAGGLGLGSGLTNRFTPKDPALLTFYGITGPGDDRNSPTQVLFDLFSPEDKRKNVTAANGFTDENGVFHPVLASANNSSTFTRKYIVATSAQNDSPVNWKVIRYADVLLMYAEALNENGKTEEAIGFLNQVRERAGVDGYESLNQDDARDKIYLERRLELSFEGHRWFDLVRTGRALEVMEPYGMKSHMWIFPVPLDQVQVVNDPTIFPQNPGYN